MKNTLPFVRKAPKPDEPVPEPTAVPPALASSPGLTIHLDAAKILAALKQLRKNRSSLKE